MAEEATSTVAETTGTETTANTAAGENTNTAPVNGEQQGDTEKLERLIQSRVDRAMADERKKSADLQKKLDKLSKEKLTDDELKQIEISDREKALAEKEKALAEKENRLYAIKAIKAAGLDDGGENSLELVDFVVGDTPEAIDTKVKAFNNLVNKFVSAKVDTIFKTGGRNPNGTKSANGEAAETSKDNTIAAMLGKQRAEQAKKSNEILSHYIGGRK